MYTTKPAETINTEIHSFLGNYNKYLGDEKNIDLELIKINKILEKITADQLEKKISTEVANNVRKKYMNEKQELQKKQVYSSIQRYDTENSKRTSRVSYIDSIISDIKDEDDKVDVIKLGDNTEFRKTSMTAVLNTIKSFDEGRKDDEGFVAFGKVEDEDTNDREMQILLQQKLGVYTAADAANESDVIKARMRSNADKISKLEKFVPAAVPEKNDPNYSEKEATIDTQMFISLKEKLGVNDLL